MSKLLLVIPAYNEQDSIVTVVNNLIENYPQFDYIIINDGSTDKTYETCKQHGFNMLNLPINLGLTGAFQTGLRYAKRKGYDYVVQFDADGQHDPKYLQTMLDKIEEGYDIVIGSRFITRKKPISLRMFGSFLISFAIRFTVPKNVKPICDPTSGMRMFNKKMIAEFSRNLNYGPEPDTMAYLLRTGAKLAEVQVEMNERYAGESYLSLLNSAVYMINVSISIVLIQWFRHDRKKKKKF